MKMWKSCFFSLNFYIAVLSLKFNLLSKRNPDNFSHYYLEFKIGLNNITLFSEVGDILMGLNIYNNQTWIYKDNCYSKIDSTKSYSPYQSANFSQSNISSQLSFENQDLSGFLCSDSLLFNQIRPYKLFTFNLVNNSITNDICNENGFLSLDYFSNFLTNSGFYHDSDNIFYTIDINDNTSFVAFFELPNNAYMFEEFELFDSSIASWSLNLRGLYLNQTFISINDKLSFDLYYPYIKIPIVYLQSINEYISSILNITKCEISSLNTIECLIFNKTILSAKELIITLNIEDYEIDINLMKYYEVIQNSNDTITLQFSMIKANNINEWILGTLFLNDYYIMFHKSLNRIGLKNKLQKPREVAQFNYYYIVILISCGGIFFLVIFWNLIIACCSKSQEKEYDFYTALKIQGTPTPVSDK